MSTAKGGQCCQMCLLFYTFLFWISGFVLIFLSIWTLVDPQRSYVLDLVDFSEDEPLLRAAVYVAFASGCLTLVVGFIACCGAIKRLRCVIITLVIFLLILFFADVTIGTLALCYRGKFNFNGFDLKMQTMLREDYGVALTESRNERITFLIDRLQFYEECCGSMNGTDWERSRWRTTLQLSSGNLAENILLGAAYTTVPTTCCVQLLGATPANAVARSLARCHQPHAGRTWRHQVGCHERLLAWLDTQTIIFTAVGFSFAAFQLVGVGIALSFFRRVHGYRHVNG